MADVEQPQIYLITPPVVDLETFPDLLAKALDTVEVACLRIDLSSGWMSWALPSTMLWLVQPRILSWDGLA